MSREKEANESEKRCICVESSCDHEGRCEKPVGCSGNDNFCISCLLNAMGESVGLS